MLLTDQARPGLLATCDARDLLARIPDGSITLVYLDPPFGIGLEGDEVAQLRELLESVAVEAKRVLRPDGNLAYTIPPAGTLTPEAFNARLVLQQLFGQDPLEISRPLRRYSARTNRPQSDREVTLWMAVSEDSVYNPIHKDPDSEEVRSKYPHEDEEGPYRWEDVTIRSNRPNLRYEVLGATPPTGRAWRYTEERMHQLIDAGRVVVPRSGSVPRLKVYVGDRPPPGIDMTWDDLAPIAGPKERAHSPQGFSVGQKPLDFARRVVEVGSNADDIILDPFCGTGTTLVAAHELKRRWIGGEIESTLTDTAEARLADEDMGGGKYGVDVTAFEPIRRDSEGRAVVSHVAGITDLQDENQTLRQEVTRYVALFQDVRELLGIETEEDGEESALAVLEKLAQVMADRLATPEKMQEYREQVRQWLGDWERLDVRSKQFLPQAEMLLDLCELVGDADYGVAVVQYCKSLESEMLQKLFAAYKAHFDEDINDPDSFLASDFEDPKTGRFARDLRKSNPKFTLGTMAYVMGLIKRPDGNTLGRSPMLQHLRDFVENYFEERVRDGEFVKEVNRITQSFRNKASHVGLIDRETALECQRAVRSCLSEFIASYRPQ